MNTLNQVVKQTTPDAGVSEFWYDPLGRLVVSQNDEQANDDDYSYTEYDALGRITEVGQVNNTSAMKVDTAFNLTALAIWLDNGTKEQITKTFYDTVEFTVTHNGFEQNNLRSRVSHMAFYDKEDSPYVSAVHYTYDIHGNVTAMVRDTVPLAVINQDMKSIEYEFDLVSGNVNKVIYQRAYRDQFIHQYTYDADNRIIEVQTSSDNVHWDREAKYFYFKHGPLSRIETGQLKVQGSDFAYTLHGWIKGVNSETLYSSRDIGKDGESSSTNELVARDVYGYTLGYYIGDFTPIGSIGGGATVTSANNSMAAKTSSDLSGASSSLYNGNIRHMITAISQFMGGGAAPQGMTYAYDQLNRISSAVAYNNLNMAGNSWSTGGAGLIDYAASFTYDANGNLKTLNRAGKVAAAATMDSFTYHYTSGTNKLEYVDDVVNSANYSVDIDDQSANNYEYDDIGNLTKDVSEEISDIDWTVYGKIQKIHRDVSSTKDELDFAYSPDGHRIMKRVVSSNDDTTTTWYVRDAQGNIMATYTQIPDTFTWHSSPIYGSSRIGVFKPSLDLVHETDSISDTFPDTEEYFKRGCRYYEMANHLGNVLVVITDKRYVNCDMSNNVTYYEADIVQAQDYYPFGMLMPGRSYTATSAEYRFGFNGQEGDDELKGNGNSLDFGARVFDPRIGVFLSIDPLTSNYSFLSPYIFAANNPVSLIDENGENPARPRFGYVNSASVLRKNFYMESGVMVQPALMRGIESRMYNGQVLTSQSKAIGSVSVISAIEGLPANRDVEKGRQRKYGGTLAVAEVVRTASLVKVDDDYIEQVVDVTTVVYINHKGKE